MKKRMNRFIYVLAALVLFATSCDWEPIMWDSSKTYIAFTTGTTVVPEDGDKVGILVMVTALEGAPAVSVDFEFDTVGIDPAKAAIEGEQYELVNDSKTLSFPDGWGYDTIWIMPIDNDIFTGDKLFNITLTSNTLDYEFGAATTNVVTVKDNEHPLNIVLGDYIETDYYFSDGSVDGTYEVNISPDPDDLSKVMISNFWGGGEVISASVDLEEMTISISTEEVIYVSGDYGDATITLLDDEYEYTDGDLLVCPIEENGDWSTPKWAATVSAGWFGKYQTSTFEKQ